MTIDHDRLLLVASALTGAALEGPKRVSGEGAMEWARQEAAKVTGVTAPKPDPEPDPEELHALTVVRRAILLADTAIRLLAGKKGP